MKKKTLVLYILRGCRRVVDDDDSGEDTYRRITYTDSDGETQEVLVRNNVIIWNDDNSRRIKGVRTF